MKVLIVTGGSSPERKISLLSANAVKEASLENRHSVTMFDFKKGYKALQSMLRDFDIVFPVMHGKEGEDGALYKFLHKNKVAYVGSHPTGAKDVFNKITFKKYCDRVGAPSAKWKIVKTKEDIMRFGFPSVLKGTYGGSSHEVILLYSKKDLANPKVGKLLSSDNRFYVEELIEGVEITVGVLNGKPLPVLEIVPPGGSWFDYKNKYSGETKEIPFAPSIKPSIQKKAQSIAKRMHNDFRLGSFSRLDAIVDANGNIYVLEINTPGGVGFTSESLYPKAARAAGYSFPELVEKILLMSLK